MTTSSAVNKFRYEGNGVTDTFAFTGRIFSTSDLIIEIILRADDTLVETLDEGSDYTVTINGAESASVVVSGAKIPSNLQDILVRRSLNQTQNLDLPTGTRFPAVSVENALDKSTALIQDLSENLSRVVTLPVTSSLTVPSIGSLTTNEVVIYDGTSFVTDGTNSANIQAAAATATTQAGIATTQAGISTTQAGLSAGSALLAESWAIDDIGDRPEGSAKYWSEQAEAFADSVNLPALGAANTVLQVNAAGDALEYGLVEQANLSLVAPTSDLQAATKKYVDDEIAAIPAPDSGFPNSGYRTNYYYMPYASRPNSTVSLTANQLRAVPFYVAEETTFTRIGVNRVSGGAANARLGIYNFENGVPTSLIYDSGNFTILTDGAQEVTISQTLASGWYALAVICDSAISGLLGLSTDTQMMAAIISSENSVTGWEVCGHQDNMTFGALPSTFSVDATLNSGTNPAIWLRKV